MADDIFTNTQNFLQILVADLSEVPSERVIFASQNAPRQIKPYITLLLIDTKELDFPDILDGYDLDEVNIIARYRLIFDIQCYGTEANSILSKIKKKLEFPMVFERCAREKISIYNTGNIIQVNKLVDHFNYEDRAQMDLYMKLAELVIDKPGEIRAVNILGKAVTQGGNIHNIPIFIDKDKKEVGK